MSLKIIRIAIIVLALLVGGTIFLVTSIKQKAEYNAPRARLETVTAGELREGMFVEGEIYELWDEFAYTEEYETTLGIKHNEKTTDRFFALPMEYAFNQDKFMFVAICSRDNSEISTMLKMEKESLDWYTKDIVPETTMHFVGKVQKLDKESLAFFKKYIADEMGVSEAEAAQYYTPYVIRSWKEDNSTVGIVIGAVMTALGLGGAVIFVVRIIKSRRGY